MHLWLALLCTLAFVLLLCVEAGAKTDPSSGHRADWFHKARRGVFAHYLTGDETTVEEWNAQVDAFDVGGLAEQLAHIGAPYYFITLGQNSGHYCTPNAAYDRYVDLRPSKCARRDLIADLYEALHPRGITLLVYLPAGAPDHDETAMAGLEWTRGPHRNREFQIKWEQVIAEWSRRWGRKVAGWWFDGCYCPDEMYRHEEPPNFASFAAAARAGNPDSIVAFNPGVKDPIITMTEHEDYTAGEINEPEKVVCPGRWIGTAQYHMLSYLGPWWGAGPPRFSDERVVEMTRGIVEKGGVVTWDVPIQTTGLIPGEFVDQLAALRAGLD